MNHDRCSELLAALLDESLSAPDRRAVEEHLHDCAECRTEKRALEAMRAVEVQPLSREERDRLGRGVRAGIAPVRRQEVIVPAAPGRSWRIRLWALLAGGAGVALAVALVAGGIDLGGDDAAREAGSGGAAVEDLSGIEGPRPRWFGLEETAALDTANSAQAEPKAEAFSQAGEDEAEGDASGGQAGAPLESSEAAAKTGADRRLAGIARGNPLLRSFAANYSAEEAGRLQDRFLTLLADAAPGDDERAQLVECGAGVVDRSEAILPAFARITTIENQRVLVLGFAWTPAASGPLDRFMVWAWPLGECELAAHYQAGHIAR